MATFRSKVEHKYAYVYGKDRVSHNSLFDLKPRVSSSDSPLIACSEEYFAVPYDGGGGPVFLSKVDATGKVEQAQATAQCVNGHKAEVLSIKFSPFDPKLFATAGDDQVVQVWTVNEDDLSASVGTKLGSHAGAAKELAFHPLASNVVLSAGAEGDVMLWDVERGALSSKQTLSSAAHGIDWSNDGCLALLSCKDKCVRALDPRTADVAFEARPHAGARSFRAVWGPAVGDGRTMLSCGPARSGGREIVVFDSRDVSKPLFTKFVDAATGALMPHYCPETNCLWVWGRGDMNVRHYEVDASASSASDALFQAVEWRSTSKLPQVGFAALPRRCLDVQNLETARFLRLTNSTVETASFYVPRTDELKTFFNDDLYPPTKARRASIKAETWLDGEDAAPELDSLRPEGAPLLSERPVEVTILHTSMVNDALAIEEAQKQTDDATYKKLQALASQYEKYTPNTSMGGRAGVDAAPADDDAVGDDEWDD
ncbi:hypothetical protein M885DRAFT_521805 [Pelagophyceae sp. CCMP2097]|nr:hypothetical protein M885DRAFT_521805 [Pelagophyceae sp. CCMP2097]